MCASGRADAISGIESAWETGVTRLRPADRGSEVPTTGIVMRHNGTVTPLLELLRVHTRPMHDALDSRLDRRERWRQEDYVSFLRATLAVLGPLEAPLRARLRAAGVSVTLPQSASLERDLQTLAQDAASIPRVELPSIDSPAEALGAAYVFIGSTLGAPVIARELRKWLHVPEHSLTYLAPRERAGVSWKHFLDTVVSFDAHATEGERQQAAQAAQATFRAFDAAFAAEGL